MKKHKILLRVDTAIMSIHRQRTHPEFVDGCFGCKASTLQWVSLDARSKNRANDRELDAYRTARKQGIQPKSTKMHDIQVATRVSDQLGKAVKV